MRWPIVFVCATLGLTTFIAPLRADELRPEMVVYLTGGKQIRGSIVESVPGKHYVVIRSDGTTFKLPWSAVRAIAPPNGPPPPPEPIVEKNEKKPEPEKKSDPEKKADPEPMKEDAPPPPLRPRAPTGPMAFVEMKSQKAIQLQWIEDGGGRWETACMSPCNRPLPVEGWYRVVDEDGRPGKPFQLGHDGKVTIQATPRSTGTDALGIIALSGGTIALYGSVLAAEDANDSTPAVAALFGVSAMIIGTILLLTNSSSVQVNQGTTSSGRMESRRRVPPGGSLFTMHF